MSTPVESSPIRVCLWAPLPPPDGGISRWTTRFCGEARNFCLEVEVINVSPGNKDFTERSRFSLSRSLVAFRALQLLHSNLKQERTDVCHITTSLFWGTPRDYLAILLCRGHGVPSVLNIHASSQIVAWRERLGGLRRYLLDTVLRSASVVTVLSAELRTYFERELPELRVVLIPNMVAADEISESRSPPLTPKLPPRRTALRVLFVGFLTPMKGLGDLAAAVFQIPACELVVVGDRGSAIDPQEQARMEDALQHLRHAGRLIETGPVGPQDVTALYREADIFALPSYREGLPNVLLEAMASGLPCVATPVGAIPEVLNGDCGILVPVGDQERLRNALHELAQNSEMRTVLGKRARERIVVRYSSATVMGTYRDLYRNLLCSELDS